MWLCSCPPLPWAFGEIPTSKEGFSDSTVGKESACNAGDPDLILGSRRSAGEGIGYPFTPVFLGFPCGSAGKESACNVGDLGWIPGLGRSLEKGKATHSSILAWRIPWTVFHGRKESDTTERLSHFTASEDLSYCFHEKIRIYSI